MKSAAAIVFLLTAAALAQSPAGTRAEALLDAAGRGDRAGVASLLDGGVSANAATRYGVSALGFAAERGHFEIVRLLVERGADVNVADSFYGSRPIDFALRGGRLDIALYLLEHGSQGAVSVLTTAIRRKDAAAVRTALDTKQADAAALAGARTLAAQAGDRAIETLVTAAAEATPARAPAILTVAPAVLRSLEGTYQSATSGASVKVTLEAGRLILTAEGDDRKHCGVQVNGRPLIRPWSDSLSATAVAARGHSPGVQTLWVRQSAVDSPSATDSPSAKRRLRRGHSTYWSRATG